MLHLNYKTLAANVILALVFTFFIHAHLTNLLLTGKLSLLITIASETLLVIMFLIRKNPISTTSSLYDYFVSIFATFIILFYRPSTSADVLLGQLFLIIGGLFVIASYSSLNRSFGIIPANRGVKTTGLYHYIRHPIYFSYFITYIGYYINNPSRSNLIILLVAVTAQVLRILREEAHLIKDIKYVEYAKQIRWRMVPYVF